ncbi:MAG TPA: hypothetical protein VI874_02155 [Candidatus Norongarragalinales archaeon]|nr:hypothetical protein [Candidatus Norongarragalinales archaeon]
MGSTCCKGSGLTVLLAGLSFLAYGLNLWKDGMAVHLAAGVFLTLYGFAKLLHAMDMCPNCAVEAPAKKR